MNSIYNHVTYTYTRVQSIHGHAHLITIPITAIGFPDCVREISTLLALRIDIVF